MQTKYFTSGILALLFFSLFTTSSVAELLFPANTKVAIVFDHANKATVYSGNSERINNCNLCTEDMEAQFGAHCINAPKNQKICNGLQTATIQNIETISVISSHRNPHCVTFEVYGRFYTFPDPCVH